MTQSTKERKPLDEVTRLYDLAVGRFDGIKLKPREIRVQQNFNPRDFKDVGENIEKFETLKASIKEMGVITPLLVRYESGNKQAILVGGERRLRACLELINEFETSGGEEGRNVLSVPVIQVKGDEKRLAMIAMVENTHKELSPMEIGRGCQSLIDHGASRTSPII